MHNPTYWPADGSLPPHVQEYVDWLIDPENAPHNKAEWARAHNLTPHSVYAWMKDSRVREAIDKGAQEVNLSPERIQRVIDAIYKAACAGDTKAQQLYLQHVDRLAPKRTIIEDRRVESMSDAELAAELADLGLLLEPAEVEHGDA